MPDVWTYDDGRTYVELSTEPDGTYLLIVSDHEGRAGAVLDREALSRLFVSLMDPLNIDRAE